MTAIGKFIPPIIDESVPGIHSVDHFAITVPDLKMAQHFFGTFGLDVQERGNTLSMKTFGHEHKWGSVIAGTNRQLHHMSFGCFAEDLARLRARVEKNGVKLVDPPKGFESNGFWFHDPDG